MLQHLGEELGGLGPQLGVLVELVEEAVLFGQQEAIDPL
jgi:hypothetical protein